jgi:hypothetical protein
MGGDSDPEDPIPYVNDTGCLLYYPFDQDSAGDIVRDESWQKDADWRYFSLTQHGEEHQGNLKYHKEENNGKLMGNARVVSGEVPKDKVLALAGGYLSVPEKHFGNTSLRSISLFFNADNLKGNQVLYQEGDEGNGLSIYLMKHQLWGGLWNNATGKTKNHFIHIGTVSAKRWHAVALVFNGTNKSPYIKNPNIRGFLDGKPSSKRQPVPFSSIECSNGKTAIGGSPNPTMVSNGSGQAVTVSKKHFKGKIDNVVIYNRGLSETDVSRLHRLPRVINKLVKAAPKTGLIPLSTLKYTIGKLNRERRGRNMPDIEHPELEEVEEKKKKGKRRKGKEQEGGQ